MSNEIARRRSLGAKAAAGLFALLFAIGVTPAFAHTAFAADETDDATSEVIVEDVEWDRVAGDNRFVTMQLITQQGYQNGSCSKIIMASGANYADALTASALSGAWNAPIITTMPDQLMEASLAAVSYVSDGNATVYIVGGTSAVSADVEAAVAKLDGVASVQRISGDDRVLTGTEIYKSGVGSWGDTAIVANAWAFPDALAVGSFAAVNKAPIFGATNGVLSDEQIDIINKNFENVVVLGGDSAVDFFATQYALGSATVDRLNGDNRFETAQKIALWASGNDTSLKVQPATALSLDNICVTTGVNFPDALAAVNLAGPLGSAILLVDDTLGDDATYSQAAIDAVIAPNALEIATGYVLGGEQAVSKTLMQACQDASINDEQVVAVVQQLLALPEWQSDLVYDEGDVADARAAYDALSDAQKAQIPDSVLRRLTLAESNVAEFAEVAQVIIDQIDALPAASDVTKDNAKAICEASDAYEEFVDSNDAKASYITNSDKLQEVVAALDQIFASDPIIAPAGEYTISADTLHGYMFAPKDSTLVSDGTTMTLYVKYDTPSYFFLGSAEEALAVTIVEEDGTAASEQTAEGMLAHHDEDEIAYKQGTFALPVHSLYESVDFASNSKKYFAQTNPVKWWYDRSITITEDDLQ